METTTSATNVTIPTGTPVGVPEEPLIRDTEWGAIDLSPLTPREVSGSTSAG